MPIPNPKAGQTEEEYIGECIPAIIDEYGQEQAAAICYSTYEKENMSKVTSFEEMKKLIKNQIK
jgi:hypothetical protein